MLRTFQTKINILDSHINPLMKFLIQGLIKVLNKSKEKFQILHISHTYLINLTFQNLQNFGMLQTTTLKGISSSRFEKASKKCLGFRILLKIFLHGYSVSACLQGVFLATYLYFHSFETIPYEVHFEV